MAKKSKKSAEIIEAQIANPAVEPETSTPAEPKKLIVAQRKFDRWFVYFRGVAPKDNVGCGCKTAKSALRYMYLLKARHGAVISTSDYNRLKEEALKEESLKTEAVKEHAQIEG